MLIPSKYFSLSIAQRRIFMKKVYLIEISVDHICYGVTSKEYIEEILMFHIRLALVIFRNDTIFAILCLPCHINLMLIKH